MARVSLVWQAGLLAVAMSAVGCSGGDGAVAPPGSGPAAAPLQAAALDTVRACPGGGLVDAAFRDAALAMFRQLAVQAPGRDAHGAVRMHWTPGHRDLQGQAWYQVQAYQANLSVVQVLRTDPTLAPLAADWLRWQARHMRAVGQGQGVVFDHWLRAADLQVAACPPALAGPCPFVDSYDSTAASMLMVADSYHAATGDVAVLREAAVQAALRASAATVAALHQADGLTWAKPDYPVAYLMDAVEVAAGWRAWARVQQAAYGDTAGAARSVAMAQRTEDATRALLWHAPSQTWRHAVQAGAPDFSRWYADTVAQAWPLLWGVEGPRSGDAANAWRRASARWLGADDWSRRNVDTAGFWWPAAAVAAQCVGDTASARAWIARARDAWLRPAQPFPWRFHVGDLRWLLWMADPRAAVSGTR